MPGRGAPEQEGKWLKKRERAVERRGALSEDEINVEEIGDWMSEQDEDEEEEEEEEEWRKVRPTGMFDDHKCRRLMHDQTRS
jgi:hypothetical protein